MSNMQVYMVLKRGSRVSELGDILDRLFMFRKNSVASSKRRHVAEKILRKIRTDGSLKATEWQKYMEELGVSMQDFYNVLRRLREAGLITKKRGHHKGEWILSKEFSIQLRDIAEYWEKWAFGGK